MTTPNHSINNGWFYEGVKHVQQIDLHVQEYKDNGYTQVTTNTTNIYPNGNYFIPSKDVDMTGAELTDWDDMPLLTQSGNANLLENPMDFTVDAPDNLPEYVVRKMVFVDMLDDNRISIGDKTYFLWDDIPTVKYALLSEFAVEPTRKHLTDAGLDFCAPLDYPVTSVKPNSYILIGTKIAIETPKNYMLKLLDKGKSTHVTGSGVVDAGYEGEIVVKLFNTTDNVIMINPGQAICQGVYIPIATPKVEKVSLEELKNGSDRGSTGGIHSL
jgi:dUTP pyrophosphatase